MSSMELTKTQIHFVPSKYNNNTNSSGKDELVRDIQRATLAGGDAIVSSGRGGQ